MIEIPETTFQGLTLPGGWKTDVPRITLDTTSPRFLKLSRMYMSLGKRPLDAEKAASEACVHLWEAVWGERVRKAVSRWAKVYADGAFGSLEGFRPEVLADLWMPGERALFIHGGNSLVRAELAKMRREGG